MLPNIGFPSALRIVFMPDGSTNALLLGLTPGDAGGRVPVSIDHLV